MFPKTHVKELTCAREMKAAEHCIYFLNSRQLLSLANGVNGPGVSTAGEDHQTLAFDVRHHCLVVVNQGVLLPLVCNAGIVDRKASLERGPSMDLTCHQNQVAQEI